MRHEAGLWAPTTEYEWEWALTENIKNNSLGKLIEDETCMWANKEKWANPDTVSERWYHAITRDLISNEIFRRVEPKGRTMGEFLREEFPDLNMHIGVDENSEAEKLF